MTSDREFGTTRHDATRVELTMMTDHLHQDWPRVATTFDAAWVLGRFLMACDQNPDLWSKMRLAKYSTAAFRAQLLAQVAADLATQNAFTLMDTASHADTLRDLYDDAASQARNIEIDGTVAT